MSSLKKILLFVGLLIFGAAAFGFTKYQLIFSPNVPPTLVQNYLHVPTGTDYQGLKDILIRENFVQDSSSFDWVATLMKYHKNSIRAGRFEIQPSWNNRQLIQQLRTGKQASVNLVLNNERLISEVAGKISTFIEPDSLAILNALSSPEILDNLALSEETIMTIFIPNTYRVYWNMAPEEFIKRMVKERDKFWAKEGRESKRQKLEMSREEVYTLASIVEKETNYKPEKATVAGVYLNRIRKGMLLQADPTVVFANQDFTLRRVLNKHLAIDSPYNTYKNLGLPPGPIAMASISSIDAVLTNEEHKYIFFCAKADNSGQHAFAKKLSAHNSNARKFQKWLSKQGIYR